MLETENIEEKENGFKNGIADTFSLLKTVIFTFLLMLFLTNCVIANAVVPTGSMENTIEPGDRIIGMRFLKNYERGDIVIFPDPDGSSHYLIKRIIGMPGDRLSLKRDGDTEFASVCINGVKLEEPYLAERMYCDTAFEDLSITIPEGSYFCMGDNRNHSLDARYWSNKLVSGEDMIAKAAFCYWPLQDITVFQTPKYSTGQK